MTIDKILDELKSREPIFHHPEKFGKTREDISKQESRDYFSNLIANHKDLDAVILGCTEYPWVVGMLPIVDPAYLQAVTAVNYARD